MSTRNTVRGFLLPLFLVAALATSGCQSCFVKPNAKPSASPSLDVSVFDFTNRTLTDITGPRGTPTQNNPYQYAGLLNLSAETNFDSNIGVRAHDPNGVKSLVIDYGFYTCAEWGNPVLVGLGSFNNGATTGPGQFTLNSTPAQENGGQVTTDLTFPITITTTDLQSGVCSNGQHSRGTGTIVVTATARNFSTNPKTQTTLGVFDIRVGNPSPVPQPPGT